jgi:hypothetical protein
VRTLDLEGGVMSGELPFHSDALRIPSDESPTTPTLPDELRSSWDDSGLPDLRTMDRKTKGKTTIVHGGCRGTIKGHLYINVHSFLVGPQSIL